MKSRHQSQRERFDPFDGVTMGPPWPIAQRGEDCWAWAGIGHSQIAGQRIEFGPVGVG